MPKTPIERKLGYLRGLASDRGVEQATLTWEARLSEIQFRVALNVLYRFTLDLYLNLNLHLDTSEFDWYPFNFAELLSPKAEEIEKAYWGTSRYDQATYDPENVTALQIERMMWELRRKATYKDDPSWYQMYKPLKTMIEQVKDSLETLGVSRDWLDASEATLALVEGKVTGAAYWDVALFDVSKFAREASPQLIVDVRDPADWKSILEVMTEGAVDNQYDLARFDYARFFDPVITADPRLMDRLIEALEKALEKAGLVEQYGYTILHPRVVWYPKIEDMHWTGGEHQLKTQRIINSVKQLLDRRGVFGYLRNQYYAFAQQLVYLYYMPRKLWKRWRAMLSEDDIVEKFKRMGCDPAILEEIRRLVKP